MLEEKLSQLLHTRFNDPGQTAVLAGAGISLNPPSSLPPAWPLMRSIIEALAPDDASREALLLACDANRPGKLGEQHFLRMERLFELIYPDDALPAAIMEMSKASRCNSIHFSLALAAAAGTIILTTNFDCLIEKACTQLGLPCKVFINDEDYRDFENYRDRKTCLILKLHGSADVPASIQTTLRHIGKGKDDWHMSQTKGMVVRNILQTRSLIVMGYSGSDDYDIVPVLTQTPSEKGLLWVEHDAEKDTLNAVLQGSGQMHPDLKSSKLLSGMTTPAALRPDALVWKTLIHTNAFSNLIWPHNTVLEEESDDVGTRVQRILAEDAQKRYEEVVQRWHDTSMLFSELQDKEQAIRYALQGRQISVNTGDKIGQSVMCAQLGTFYAHLQDYANADQYLTEAETLAKNLRLESTLSIVYSARSWIFDKTGDKNAEIAYLRKAIALDRRLGKMDWLAVDLNHLATAISDDQPDEAYQMHREALQIARAEGNMSSELTYLNNGFLLFRGRIHPSEIRKDLAYAEELALKAGNVRALVEIYGNMGSVHDELSDFTKAVFYLEKAVEQAQLIGLEEGAARWTSAIGDIYRKAGKIDEAVRVLNAALPVLEKYESMTEIGTVHGRLGLIYTQQEQFQKAAHHLTKALEYDEKAGWTRGMVDDLGNLGQLHQSMGNYSKAFYCFQKAVDLARQTRYQVALARNLGNLGMELSRNDRHAEALKCDEEAMEINVQLGNREGEAYTRVNLAGDYFQAGRMEDAVMQLYKAREAATEIGLPHLLQHINTVLGQLGVA